RNNALINAALPGTNLQVFELLSNGSIRLLSPETGQGQELKSTIFPTTKALLAYLNCSGQWEAAFQAALEQAALGQDSELEFQTMDQEETWIQVRLEPQGDRQQAEAIGTIRVVTQEVQERYRQEAADKLLDRMMKGTVAGLEISLEEDTWRMLWGWEAYGHLIHADGTPLSYTEFVHQQIAPTVHPKDREAYLQAMDRKALLGAFLTGTTERFLDYRVKTPGKPGYDWHASELYLYRDAATRQVKANYLIRQVTDYRRKQLEEKRQLEEKEHTLLLRAQKLVESEEELDFVHVIANYYQGIYVVDLKEDQTRAIQVPDYFAELLAQSDGSLSRTMELYSETCMNPEYIPAFRSLIRFDSLRETLDEKGQAEMTFQKKDGAWINMRILPMPGYGEQQPKTLWIFEDDTITENLRQEEEKARVTAQAAEAASQAKSQFLANMSHDIRTPLNAILGMSELGLREENPQEKDNCFRDIRGSGRILLDNINSILDLSKIEAGKMEITRESYQVLSTLHDVITILRMRAQEKKLDFQARVDENIPATLYGDDVNISHIIMNLGSNAVKYTPQGRITLTVNWEPQGEDGSLLIYMEDTGVGIRREELPYIFQSYGRLDRKANRHIEGTGLGLTICKQLTELMGGQLGVESTHGVGSTFWVHLPQKVVDPTPCGPYQEGVRPEKDDRSYNSFTAPEAVVLVVDDQPLNLKVCQGLLGPYEMEVYTARSGQEALRQMTQVWPDLVLMDHMMPEMDGVETTQRIREMGKKDPYFAVVPIIALTANAMKGAKEAFLNNGFNDFISKPMELDQMDQVLRAWIPEDKQKAPSRPLGDLLKEPIPEDLQSLPGIDVARGMSYCGTGQVYRKTLFLFREQIHGRLRRIRQAWEEGRLEDYVIEVHSLKSAARWIGAMDLGDQAEALEMAGRAQDTAAMAADTPALLDQCQKLGETLAFL
ncbi:MAG: response regulator, partial [Clostridiales bacterium]|nr:response regulator [Clostridiales bacterium]